MKRLALVWLVGVSLLGLALGRTVYAAELDALQITDIDWQPRTAFPGDELRFRVSYVNGGDTAVADNSPVALQLLIQTRDSAAQEVVAVEREIGGLDGLAPGQTRVVTATLIGPSAADYEVIARLAADGQTVAERSEPFLVENPLPPGVTQLFAGLGMFIAVITMMALGTEVVIDSLKFFIGLKQKVTAMEAYDKLERDLPGELTALGVDEDAIAAFKQISQDLRQTLQPVNDAAALAAQLRDGAFGDAYDALVAMAPAAGQLTEAQLATLKSQAGNGVRKGFQTLRQTLSLTPKQTAALESYLLAQIDGATVETAASLMEEVFDAIAAWSPQLTEEWLTAQVDTLLSDGRTRVTELMEANLLPALEGLGFDRAAAKTRLEAALDELETAGRGSALAYVASLRHLLLAVEERRNAMQSPLRKIYRRLRQSALPFGGIVAGAVTAVLAWWAMARFLWTAVAWAGFLEFLTAIALALLIGGLVAAIYNRLFPGGPQLGPVLRGTEYEYNRLLGRDQPTSQYGEIETDVIRRINNMGPTTVAQVLMEREDKHRDEEASRLRVIRVISLFVGVILAYLLQIDAATLLNEAVPGVAGSINAFLDIPPDRLNAFWDVLPDANRLTAGIILTGLAASAGSAFWHEQLGRLQGAKEQAEAAAKLLRRARDLPLQEE